jgi:uncharacterized protein YbjT (DUF2867 family)
VRVFVAGATGVIGIRLVPLLVAAGHEVAGMTRSPGKVALLRDLGADPVVGDIFDAGALRAAVVAFGPDAVVHQVTDLPDDEQRIAEFGESNARVRREGTANLLIAARAADVSRFVAQSVAWPLEGRGGEAVAALERAVLAADGVVIRYGRLYGPGTYYPEQLPPPPRIHVDEAARRTVATLDAPSGVILAVEGAERAPGS